MNKHSEERLPNYGGQALIEGILMRGRSYVVASFRTPDGSIQIENENLGGINQTKLARLPFFRGLAILWDSLSLGMKYLTLSANVQTGEDEKIEGTALIFTLLLSIAFSIGLFFVIPSLLISLISRITPLSSFSINLGEGILRL